MHLHSLYNICIVYCIQFNIIPLINFSSNEKKPKIQGGKVKYKTRNIDKVSKNLNMGKGVHTRFDTDGNEMTVKPCRTLNKVKNFLGKLNNDPVDEIDDFDQEVMEIMNSKDISGVDNKDKTAIHSDDIKNVTEQTNIQASNLNTWSMHVEKGTSFNFMKDDINTLNDCTDETAPDTFQFTGVDNDQYENSEHVTNFEREAVEYDLDIWNDSEDKVNISSTQKKQNSRKKKKRQRGLPMPVEVAEDPQLRKYWGQRYRLFSKFDEGVKLDRGKCTCKLCLIYIDLR
jgi:hypothetical protein